MKRSVRKLGLGVLALAILGAGVSWSAAAGEDAMVKVFVSWQGVGNTFQTGAKQATFVGALMGPVYTETERGPVHTATMVCPVMVAIGLEDAVQRGTGHCTFTQLDGAEIYADISCTGISLVGCAGELKLIGGTKRFEGVSGGGHVTIRSDFRQITQSKPGVAKEEGTGSLFVQELRYKLP